jgi:Uma2 family endonuclease
MTVATESIIPPAGSQIVIEEIGWDAYETIRQETEGRGVRISYDGGRMVLMSPLPKHEWAKRRIGRLLEMATLEWGIPISSLGSTTWKRRDLLKGLEADECYYIQHEAQIRSRDDLDLANDPPPDIAVEIDITSVSINRQKIYASLGINELWRHDGRHLQFLKLGLDGNYHPIDRSDALPRLSPADIERFLAMFGTLDENSVLRKFQDWLRGMR